MSDSFGFKVSDEIFDFIKDMESYIESQTGFVIQSDCYGVSLDPVGDNIEVWHCGECVSKFNSIKDFLFGFEIQNKKIIEIISDFDFS